MLDLYRITYNKKQWTTKKKGGTLVFINKVDHNAYFIYGDIIGIAQIRDNEFLVYRRILRERWKIQRICFHNGEILVKYEISFRDFTFITNDTILFDNRTVYSIYKNEEVREFSWLKYHDLKLIRDIKGHPYFIVSSQTSSGNQMDDYVIVIVDAITFKPVTEVYSTLRCSFIPLSNSPYTFDGIAKEDSYYVQKAEDILGDLYKKNKIEAINTLLQKYIDDASPYSEDTYDDFYDDDDDGFDDEEDDILDNKDDDYNDFI